uniref:Uncharacterized protein n=1 Tax=Anguilla anguilla TaxID=7936 RepID=A0A0E9SPU2_ANGAN
MHTRTVTVGRHTTSQACGL